MTADDVTTERTTEPEQISGDMLTLSDSVVATMASDVAHYMRPCILEVMRGKHPRQPELDLGIKHDKVREPSVAA